MPFKDLTSPEAKESIRKANAKCKAKNKERYAEAKKKYRQSDKGKMMMLKDAWKQGGLKTKWQDVWEIYVLATNCYFCNKILKDKCMDHNHTTGMFRGVCCKSCNEKLGITDRNFRAVISEIKFINNLPSIIKSKLK